MNQSDPEASIRAAYADAKARGLPDCWTCSIDKRNRRKWTAPTGRSCDSIPKAMAISVELGLLPPETVIQYGPNKRKRPPPLQVKKKSAKLMSQWKKKQASSSAAAAAATASGRPPSTTGSTTADVTAAAKRTTTASHSLSSSSSSDSDESMDDADEEEEDTTPPEPMDPETSLDGLPRAAAATTVHWDGLRSADGQLIGWIVKVLLPHHDNEWHTGRVVLYDPYTHKHKIEWEAYEDDEKPLPPSWIWLRNEEHALQLATRLVWAHVKGYAWWPALVMENNDATDMNPHYYTPPPLGGGAAAAALGNTTTTTITTTTTPFGSGSGTVGNTSSNRPVQVEFLSTQEISSLRDSPDCLREFSPMSLDPVVARHKKKRNAKAVALANTEWKTIRRTRREASLWYAKKAWHMAQTRGQGYLGKRVQIFRNDVNYPYGDTVTARVKLYSTYQKKWLLAYELTTTTDGGGSKTTKYEASWVNLLSKQTAVQVLDKRKPVVTLEDLLPFVHEFDYDAYEDDDDDAAAVATTTTTTTTTTTDMDTLVVPHKQMAQLYRDRCHACAEYWKQSDLYRLECSLCKASFHLGCCDPPLSLESFQRMLKDGKPLVCSRCQPCRGCFMSDITFGSHPYTPRPPSLTWPHTSKSLDLCSMCKDAYDEKRFCPNCAHTWDDVKFQKIRRQMEHYAAPAKKNQGAVDTLSNVVLGDFTVDARLPDGATIPPIFYYPETSEWGYTEIEMLVCDGCKVWVHAGCAGITEDEYNETSEGEHPIYSREFLCRMCCRQRCQDIIHALRDLDTTGVFAVPVTDKVAPNYHDVISNPMDLQTMQERATVEEYLNYAWVREAFELIVLNALTFNNHFTKYWSEAKRFYNAGLDKVFRKLGKAAPPGKYEPQIQKSFKDAEEARKNVADRMQIDETVEKKDLVAGSMADASIVLPELQEPPDVETCVPCHEVKLKPVDAFYSCWMDTCFSCGSSGANDTMLFCVDCGEAYHSFCASTPIHSMTEESVTGWRCPNCKVCEISGDVPQDETHMIFCEMSDRAFSLGLLDPPLKEAPPGLFISGQCVDCKVCKNTSDPRGASLKHWSRDPDLCYSCGGCKGLVDESDVTKNCKGCRKFLHEDEPGVVQCDRCSARVHCKCDPRAEKYVRSKENASRAKKAKKIKAEEPFVCASCLTPAEIAAQLPETMEIQRQGVYETAWKATVENDLTFGDGPQGTIEFYTKLTGEMEWSVRNMYRDEYLSIVQDAVRVFNLAQASFAGARNIIQPVFNRVVDVPLWEAQRALRFIGMVERGKWNESIEINTIAGIVTAAKVAAAFLDVSSVVMGYNLEAEASCADRIRLLLEEPDDCETTVLPYDKIMQKIDPVLMDISEMDATDSYEHPDVSGMSSEPAEVSQASPSVPMAEPLVGWNEELSADQAYGRWQDPRECCLCHMCGDDDAGLAEPLDGMSDDSKQHLGRLLPLPDGSWVHASCALWSSEVWEAQEDGLLHAVEKARIRGSQLKCFGCGRHGATAGCSKSNCNFNYHLPCAMVCGAVFTRNQHLYCASHSASALQRLPRASHEPMRALIISPEKKSGAEKETPDSFDDDLCTRVGSLVVHSLGTIDQDEDSFYSENYITPAGYFSTRIFWSTVEPRKRALYILQVQRTEGRPEFCITATDHPSLRIRSSSPSIAYSTLMDRVRKVNAACFSHGDLFSRLPMMRRSRRKTHGLNGNQFFGFGLNPVRRMLESITGVEAVVTPLTPTSPKYRFCFVQPPVDAIRDLQRKRAVAKAELALENSTGCARTEGLKAVAQSGGSGRITRALVRSTDEMAGDGSAVSGHSIDKLQGDKSERGLIQVKYRKMCSVPMEQRLAARRSHIHGWGLFTKVDIAQNDPIVEYMGEVVRQPVADQREKRYEISGEGSCYMFRLDRTRIVDATGIGCMTRFMNHSCSSNAFAKIISVDTEVGQEKKIVVFANRDIAAGEEITYDYKFELESSPEMILKCSCGAANCIGRLN